MEPTGWDMAPQRPVVRCLDCDGPLGNRRLRCESCYRAALAAIRTAGGKTVRPSDVAKARAD